ncbi:hypothetical protein M9H77_29674 [Catharanthus roseus]|uniref:Uncharacterized protein n=1 Tax=Catharanthus roseus TaxID=4058 RepID=A0ACB9ZXP6_CATRO|nr:hypothetical protein M9H77_29674 [Catharanthus roseus]
MRDSSLRLSSSTQFQMDDAIWVAEKDAVKAKLDWVERVNPKGKVLYLPITRPTEKCLVRIEKLPIYAKTTPSINIDQEFVPLCINIINKKYSIPEIELYFLLFFFFLGCNLTITL